MNVCPGASAAFPTTALGRELTSSGEPHARRTSSAGETSQFDVAFYSPWLGPLISSGRAAGGAETQILLLARALAARGQRVCLIVEPTDGPLPASVGGVQIRAQAPRRGRNRILRLLSGLSSLIRVLGPLEATVFVQRAAGTTTGMVGLIARIKRRRFVYSSANVIDFDYGRLEPNRLKVWLFHLGVRAASAIVVQSREQAALCRSSFGRSPAVIKSIAEQATQRASEPEALLWVGRVAHYKRPEAFVALARAVPEARFWMVAVPSNDVERQRADELERAAAKLPNLELLAPRPRQELLELIDSAVAMVNTADYEGMPNIFLESWARGVPALSLSHDPDGLIEREGLGGFAEGSPGRLAALAREMWESRHGHDQTPARCRDYLEREHAIDAVAESWIAALGLPPRSQHPTPGG